jgi:4-hydroxy-tetrahydrodipicolinate synthase
MQPRPISGCVAAAVTPLRDHGASLDEDAFPALLGFYRDTGLAGILILGTTGEGILLSDRERRRTTELAVAESRDLPVLVHCGAQTTAETCELAEHAAQCGADGVAVIGPPYYSFAPEELLEHFATAAASCAPLPFYVYEYQDRSGYVVPASVVERLRERAPNLVGMKVSDGSWDALEPYLATGLDVFIGAEALISEGLGSGAAGAVSGVAAAFPEAVADLVNQPTPERLARVTDLRDALSEAGFQASLKAALGLRGLPVSGDMRAPLLPVPDAALEPLRLRLEQILGRELASAGTLSRR